MKRILSSAVALTFLIGAPALVLADKAPPPPKEKKDKDKKDKDKKDTKGDKADKADKGW